MEESGVQKEAEIISYENCSPYLDQIAGHGHKDKRFRLLNYSANGIKMVLKPTKNKELRIKEIAFYVKIFSQHNNTPIAKFIPKFYGIALVQGLPNDQPDDYYIKLENLTAEIKDFSSMDLKIGAKTFASTDPPEKIKEILQKYRFQEELAMRICGMRVFDRKTKKYTQKNSVWGKKVTPSTLTTAVKLFFESGLRPSEVVTIIEGFLEKLETISAYFERQREFEFRGSSLYLVYYLREDGGFETSMRMIDFCHVSASGRVDEGYCKGLKRFRKELEKIRGIYLLE